MRIPKKIRMLGYDWKVFIKKNENSGSFSWKTKVITIGSRCKEQEAIFLHEIMEAILADLGLRWYGQEDAMEYHFFFNHSDFCKFHKILFQTLKDNKLI